MIVFDASTLVSATFNSHGIPAQALQRALREDRVAISEPIMTELVDVLYRPEVARFLTPERRAELLGQLVALGVPFEPAERVTECRDPKDDKYLELALASGAGTIVSSDGDLLVPHPWRGVRILLPAAYLAQAGTASWPPLSSSPPRWRQATHRTNGATRRERSDADRRARTRGGLYRGGRACGAGPGG